MADSYEQNAATITESFTTSLGEERAAQIAALVTGSGGNAVVQVVSTLSNETVAQIAEAGATLVQVDSAGPVTLTTVPDSLKVLVFSSASGVAFDGTNFGGTLLFGSGNDRVNLNYDWGSTVVGGAGTDLIYSQAAAGATTGSGATGMTIDPGAGSNTVVGSAGADIVYVGAGAKDTVNGGAGIDTLKITGKQADFTITVSGSKVTADNAKSGTHLEATNSDILQFDDGVVVNASNVSEAALARFYEVIFNRTPDAGGMEFWLAGLRDGNFQLVDAANGFLASNEASALGVNTLSTSQFLDALYQQAFGRAADAGGKAFWTSALDDGLASRAEVIVGFAESAEASVVITGVNTITGSV